MSKNHSFNVEIATRYGVACALLLEHIGHWVKANKANGVNRRDGKYWMYKSVKGFALAHPYLTEYQIRRALDKLRKEELIEVGHYANNISPSTLWYTLTRKGKKLLSCNLANPENRFVENAKTIWQNQQNDLANPENRFVENAKTSIDITEDNITEEITEERITGGGGREEIVDNPFGDAATAAPFTPDPLVIYASNNLMAMNADTMDELISFRGALPDELIRHAINEACGSGVRRYKYVKSILNRYVEEGFKTVADVEAYEAERKKRKGGTNGGEHRRDSSAAPQRIAGETIV